MVFHFYLARFTHLYEFIISVFSFLQLFDHCLAPNILGDGTGCDNMTCIIIVLHPNETEKNVTETDLDVNSKKRKASDENDAECKEPASKKTHKEMSEEGV